MKKKEIKHYEQRLLEERQKILKEMGHFGENFQINLKDSSGDLSSYSFHMADQGTDVENQERAYQQMSKEGRLLYHVDEALRRLYSENGKKYGLCESCGKPIEETRLDLVPHARLCFKCKSQEENGG
jgi:RNA polymerase-binding protein DksA